MRPIVFITAISFSLLITGCCIYHPQTTDIPLIRGKKDLRVDAGVSLVPGIQSTISYGLTKKIAIQVYGSTEGGGKEGRYYQVAPGIYKAWENHMVMELYGGYGHGYSDAYRDANGGHLTGNYQICFLQYNIGKYSNKSGHFEFGFGIKSGYFRSDLNDRNYYGHSYETGPLINYKENSILLEPQAFLRVGGEKVKFSLKAGACQIYKLENPEIFIPTFRLNIGLGLSLSPKFK